MIERNSNLSSSPLTVLRLGRAVVSIISDVFLSSQEEQGVLLGATHTLSRIDCCRKLAAIDAGQYYYVPDSCLADKIVHEWGERGVCFCGFVHSHISNKNVLSEQDIIFAKRLARAYNLPIFWFGIGVVSKRNIDYHFYAVVSSNDTFTVTQTELRIVE